MGEFGAFLLVGFLAQLVDGALGMGFGVISSAILLGQGLPPPLVSASVNAAKLPTGATSAASHLWHGNVDWAVVRKVAGYGAAGGIAGALLLTSLKGPVLAWLINLYLTGIGLMILWRGLRGIAPVVISGNRLRLIGASGGAIEGIGGSWGPIVTSGLLGSGLAPRYAVGSSNISEFAVSAVVFLTLFAAFHLGHWGETGDWREVLYPVAGLVCGGVPAAFAGGWLAARAPKRPLTVAVGLLVLGIAAYRMLG
ncbi:MAG: sulfite exporter TauE/SafE family protein [Rhodobacteraceae bacterium]|nr:sulfite exporter TauE/SafE family protein [Paracoccaceae bacterium]